MKMRVQDLIGWQPGTSEAFSSRGGTFEISIENVLIQRVVRIVKNRVDFICTDEAKDLNYTFPAPDEKTAQKLEVILNNNIGKTLFSIGTIEIPED